MATTKAVIFDLGNVLVFFSFEKMIAQVSKLSGLSPQRIQELLIQEPVANLSNFEGSLHAAYESGRLSSQQIYTIFSRESPKSFTLEEFFHAASNIFQPNEPIFPLVEELKKKGLRLILLSNTNPAHYEFLMHLLPILDLFDEKILSYEVGASKPEPRIYATAIEAAQCIPQECFYTDDILEYVTAARTHGLNAELYTDVPSLQKHLGIRHLA
jgi:putative hydrolase of the HAD superfamily